MKIRNTKIEDLDRIIEIAQNEPFFKVSDTDNTCFWDKNSLKRMIESPDTSVFLTSEDKGKITGFVISQYWDAGKKAIFENAFIMPEHRKSGLYKKLGLKMIGRLKNMGCQYICSFPEIDNKISYKSLEKNFGFDRGKKYYWSGKFI